MSKLTKKRKIAVDKFNFIKNYSLSDGVNILKKSNQTTKFDPAVDIAIHLNIDPRKVDQMIRGVVALPNGTGRIPKVLVLCQPDKENEARSAGADHVGLDDYIKKIEGGWVDVDYIITTPNLMAKVGKLGRILGPKKLMPNPKSGTVTLDVGESVKEIKKGKITIKTDKYGIVHARVASLSFISEKIQENVISVIEKLLALKPATVKGTYIKSVSISTTMGYGIKLDKKTLPINI